MESRRRISHMPTLAVFMALIAAAPASAESLWLDAVYPAAADLPAQIQIIATEPFGGDLGPDAQIAIVDVLGSARVEGQPWFRFSQAGSVFRDDATLDPDAALRGSVRSEVIERRVDPRIDERCVARDDKDKCTEREEVRVPCRELTVRVDPRLVLIGPDGTQFYAYRDALIAAQRFCRDEDTPSANVMMDALVDDLALNIRNDLVPKETRTGIRIMERRKGLSGDDRGAFRAAVKLTDDDPQAACAAFEALEQRNSDHSSVLFNIGLCREVQGDLAGADDYYIRVLEVDPGRDYAQEGINRIGWQRRGQMQLIAREQM